MSEPEFERRVGAALRAPVAMRDARGRIMERVRALPASERPLRRPPGVRRTWRHSIAGVALAAGIGSVGALPSLLQGRPAAAGFAAIVIGDSVDATMHDTLRLVRLMLVDTTARHVALVGDFNAWRADRTPLQRDPATGRWTATVALRDGEHRYAFVVDNTRWTIDPAAPHGRGDDGRLTALLHVKAATN